MNEFDAGILLVVLLCSVISGATGILGGAILLAYLLDSFTFTVAMVSHGAIQLFLNFFRAFLFRAHIKTSSIFPFAVGATLSFLLLTMIAYSPSAATVFMCLGAFGIAGTALTKIPWVGFSRTSEIFTAGAAVSGATVLCGVGGPLLDTFLVRSPLTRAEIMGTKSLLQGGSHFLKVAYFLNAQSLGSFHLQEYALVPGCIAVAFAGTHIGKQCNVRMSEGFFRALQFSLILATSVYFLRKGYTCWLE